MKTSAPLSTREAPTNARQENQAGTSSITDHRPEAQVQLRQQQAMAQGPRTAQLQSLQRKIRTQTLKQATPAQLQAEQDTEQDGLRAAPVAQSAVQLKADPYNIFVRVVQEVRDTGNEKAAVDIIKTNLAEWDEGDKKMFLKYLPEKYHRLATAAGMENLLAQGDVEYEKGLLITNNTVKARMEAGKPFYTWLYKDGPEPSKMNCWETVLLAAFKVGKLSKENIQALINRTGGATLLASEVIANADGNINKEGSNEKILAPSSREHFIQDDELEQLDIPIGKVVIFGNYGQHVALAAGGTAIYENDSDPGNLVKSTLAAAIGRNRKEYGSHLSWGDLPSA